MFEAYSVAIKLRLVDSVSSGLVGLAASFAKFNRSVEGSSARLTLLEGQLSRIKGLAIAGGAAAAVGGGALAMLAGPIRAAREYELAFTKFKTLNLGDAVNAQADKFARSANIMGVSAKQLMNTMSESVGIFGSYAEAQKYVPRLAALNVANSAIFHGKIGDIDEGATRSLIKFMDRRGLTKDQAGFNAGLDLAERLITGSGGFIQFRDLAAFSQQGGTAFRGLSDQGLINYALLLQEQGGARAGTALMSIYQNLVSGRTPVKTMHYLEDMGFGHISQRVSGTVGGKKSTSNVFELLPVYAAMMQADPVGFFSKVVPDILAKKGITSDADMLRAINMMLSNRTGSNQASIASTQQLQVVRDAALTQNAMGVDQAIGAYGNNPNARYGDLRAKYTNLLLELGESALPLVTRAISGLIGVVRGLTSFARSFPTITKVLVTSFAGLAAASAAGGTLMLATAGIRGLGVALKLANLGPLLVNAARGIAAIGAGAGAGKLGVWGAAGAAAGAAGYAAGSWLNSFGPNGDLGGYLGARLADFFQRSDYIAQQHVNKDGTVTNVYLDGHKVSKIVTGYQARAADASQNTISGFDSLAGQVASGGLSFRGY